MAALKTYITPKVNVVVERHAFRKRAQGTQDTVLQYVAALRELVVTCDFGDRAEEMIP